MKNLLMKHCFGVALCLATALVAANSDELDAKDLDGNARSIDTYVGHGERSSLG